MKKQSFRIIGALVVLAWLVFMGLLVARQRVQKPAELQGNLPAALLEEEWMTVRFHGEKIGWGRSKITQIPGGYRVEADASMTVKAMGATQKAKTNLEAEVDPEFHLVKFDFNLETSAQDMRVDGEVNGLELRYNIYSPADAPPDSRSMKLEEPVTLQDGAVIAAWQRKLKVGDRFEISSFDPTSQLAAKSIVEVKGREEIESRGKKVNAWVLKTTFSGIETTTWLDDDGRTLRSESAIGFTIEAESKAEALQNEGPAKLDVVSQLAIRTDHIPNPRQTKYLRAELSGVDDIESADLDGGVQSVVSSEEGKLTLTIEIPPLGSGYNLPDSDPARAEFIGPEDLIQSDDVEIVEAAKKIAGGETNSVAVAKRLNDWLYQNVEKKATLTLPSAREVWHSKSGDCNEHTVLYTALARALGLPARIASGVVYLDGAFYYHAWPEVWLGDEAGWVPAEPTLDEFPADATHVRLAIGALKNQLAITRFVGKLKIKILESKTD